MLVLLVAAAFSLLLAPACSALKFNNYYGRMYVFLGGYAVQGGGAHITFISMVTFLRGPFSVTVTG